MASAGQRRKILKDQNKKAGTYVEPMKPDTSRGGLGGAAAANKKKKKKKPAAGGLGGAARLNRKKKYDSQSGAY